MTALVFAQPYKALVIGASGAIGNAFVEAFRADPLCTDVVTVARSQHIGFDLRDPAAIQAQAQRCQATGPYNVIVDATGALTIEGVGPEKSLASLRQARC